MSDSQDTPRPASPGVFERGRAPRDSSIAVTDVAALLASAAWLGLCGVALWTNPSPDALPSWLVLALIVLVPLGLIWVAAVSVGAARAMRAETARLHTTIEALRKAYLAQAQSGTGEGTDNAVLRRLSEMAATQKNLESMLAMLGGTRSVDAPLAIQPTADGAADESQASLSLGTPAEALDPPLSNADFVQALNFPETAEDQNGFAALRRALRDRQTAQLIRASQDVLTLLSQDGIYMDDLRPDMARPEVWRAFAEGARGRAVAGLGGVRDRSSLALTAGRMKQDPIFKDAAHHFLRRFDQSFAAFAARADDAEIQAFSDTRTARAFMILGRVAGTFD